jgi:hypothetical protein
MQRKSSTTVRDAIGAKEVTQALSKARTLASEEEKVLRMRYGSKVAEKAPLARHGEGNPELQDELLLMEMELLRAFRMHQKQMAARAKPQQSRAKDKIVRALRKKH